MQILSLGIFDNKLIVDSFVNDRYCRAKCCGKKSKISAMGTNQHSDIQWPWPTRSIQLGASGSSMKGIFKSVISSVIEFYCRQEDEACALVEEKNKKIYWEAQQNTVY